MFFVTQPTIQTLNDRCVIRLSQAFDAFSEPPAVAAEWGQSEGASAPERRGECLPSRDSRKSPIDVVAAECFITSISDNATVTDLRMSRHTALARTRHPQRLRDGGEAH
jgi:hypothetical protein